MKKIIAYGCLSLVAAFPLFAFSSFSYYVGVSGGANINSAHIEQNDSVNFVNTFDDIIAASHDLDQFTGIGQVQLGGGFRNRVFYLGAELSGQFFNGDFGSVNSSFVTNSPAPVSLVDKSKLNLRNFEAALDLKPGIYLYKHTLLYARVGVAANRLEFKQDSIATNTSTGDQLRINTKNSEDDYPLRLGLGLERRINDDLSIVMDYIYTQYDSISTNGSGSTDAFTSLVPITNVDSQSKADDISRNVVMIGLNYYL